VSAPSTVIATSAEGAGDMPSATPVSTGDTSLEDAQPFSEVLSLSSSSFPAPPNASAPPSSAPVPDEQGTPTTDVAEATVPTPPPEDDRTSSGGRGRRGTGASGRDDAPARSAPGSFVPRWRAGETGGVPPAASTRTGAESAGGDPGQRPAAVPLAVSAPSDPVTPAVPARDGPSDRATVTATIVPDGPPGAGAQSAQQGAEDVPAISVDAGGDLGRSVVAASVPRPADSSGDGSSPGPARGDDPADRTGGTGLGAVELRVLPARPAPGSAAPEGDATRLQATATLSDATGSSVTGPGVTGPGVTPVAGSSDPQAVATAELDGFTEFPDAAGSIAGASVDIGGLAAAISRPLAAGNGDYSVQVSLHPPELGEVRALLAYQGDVLHVTLTPEHASGFEALSDAMPTLKDQLAGGGVEVHVTLGQPGDPQGGESRPEGSGGPALGSDGTTPAAGSPPTPANLGDPGRIHLVL
jgi:flagellar hook-length control protein FliK